MNIQWRDNYIDATNTFVGGGGGGDTIINGQPLENYIYVISNSNLYINNPNSNGLINFTTYNNPNNVKIDTDGRLKVYHDYDILLPTIPSGWYDVKNEIVGGKFNDQGNTIAILALGADIALINTQLQTIEFQFTVVDNRLLGLELITSAHTDLLSSTMTTETYEQLVDTVETLEDWRDVFGGINNAEKNFYQTVIGYADNAYGIVGGIGFGAGIIGTIYSLVEGQKSYNLASNISNINFEIPNNEREYMLQSNVSNQIIYAENLLGSFSNFNIHSGFINSNIITTQFVPSLKSNKILLGNITTPNSSYQMEMTGDMNANEYYRNSTSLTSLLAQKQDNISVTAPIYFTTGNIGLLYDSSLTKVGNNLSVVKTASAPLRWSGNNLVLDYDSTLINNSGNLGVSIGAESKWAFTGGNIYNKTMTNVGIGTDRGLTHKLNVVGDSYFSSNVNIATSKLNFIGSYSGQSAFGLATGTNEYYIQYTANGTLTLNEPCACDILCVGAGGNGGAGNSSGGGGAGEVIYFPNFPLRSGTLNITVGTSSTTPANRISRIYPSSGNEVMRALGGGDGGSPNWYSTSGGTVSALTSVSGTFDAYLSITASTNLTLNLNSGCIVDILVIGGGGGGSAGGGGAGGFTYLQNQTLNSGTYEIKVGAGGLGGYTNFTSGSRGSDGEDSYIKLGSTTIAIAYRGGGGAKNVENASVTAGVTYGSTGGNGNDGSTTTNPVTGQVGGNKGGLSSPFAPGIGGYGSSGGGGGAGGVGGNGIVGIGADGNAGGLGGAGGVGLQCNITGTNTYYAGGGGGGTNTNASTNTNPAPPQGGLGGGGNGSWTANGVGANATANTGGGGGGGDYEATGRHGSGGSGIVIIRFRDYQNVNSPTSGGSGGGGGKVQVGASAGVKFDEYKSFVQAGLTSLSTLGANGGSGSSLYNTRFTTTITGTSLSVGLGGSGVGVSPPTPTTKTNYGDGGDGNGGVGYQGVVIIRFKESSSHLQLKAIKDNANTGLILNANETVSGTTTPYQLRIFPWSDTYTNTGVVTRGWSFRTHDGLANQDLINLFSYFGGRVGIKTKNPTAVLDVNGDIQCKTFNIIGNEQYGVNCQIVNQNAIGEASFGMYAGQGTSYGGLAFYYLPTDNLGYISCSKSFKIKTGNDAANSYIYINNTNGYVGIGITNPASKLGVNGIITASDIQVNNGLNATLISAGQIYGTGIDTPLLNNYNGTITNVNNLFTSNIYINNAIDMQNKNILNCGYLYGGANWANEWKAYTNYYHKDDQGRDRIYFKNDTGAVPNHFTLFKSGGTTHTFADKDDVQYCLLERFGITTYFEVISGGGYDNVGVPDGVTTGTYVFRKMYLRLSTFTEVHRCFIDDVLYLNYDDFINEFIGRIVVSKGKIKTALKEAGKDWEILEGKDGITIDDSHPVVELSRKKKDKAVIGVITKRNQNTDMPNRLVINSLGEGAVWVVNTNGNFEAGDLITTSNEIGYGERQDDDFIKNYTLGKSMINCNFELDSPDYKCEIIDVERDLRRAFLPCFYYSG